MFERQDYCILKKFDSLASSLAASAALLAGELPEHENIDLEHAFVVIDSLDLANLVLDDHLLVFSVSATNFLWAQTLYLLGYVALFQPSPCDKPLDLANFN